MKNLQTTQSGEIMRENNQETAKSKTVTDNTVTDERTVDAQNVSPQMLNRDEDNSKKVDFLNQFNQDEITAADFVSDKDESMEDISELVSACEQTSKEFTLSGENSIKIPQKKN